jgi:phage terminase small subunit
MSRRIIRKSKKIEDRLTEKEWLFCKHYLSNDFAGKKAAISAGFSEKSAKWIAHQLLKKPHVQEYLKYRLKEVGKKLDITFERKLRLLWKTAKRCYGLTDDEVKRFREGETIRGAHTFEPDSLIKAVAELNKMQGHYAEKQPDDNSENDTEKLSEEIKKYEREF